MEDCILYRTKFAQVQWEWRRVVLLSAQTEASLWPFISLCRGWVSVIFTFPCFSGGAGSKHLPSYHFFIASAAVPVQSISTQHAPRGGCCLWHAEEASEGEDGTAQCCEAGLTVTTDTVQFIQSSSLGVCWFDLKLKCLIPKLWASLCCSVLAELCAWFEKLAAQSH